MSRSAAAGRHGGLPLQNQHRLLKRTSHMSCGGSLCPSCSCRRHFATLAPDFNLGKSRIHRTAAIVGTATVSNQRRYVELHLHTAFSFLDGASSAEELIGRARELGYGALAVTDHDGLYGAMEFAQAAQAAGIRPITGAEVTLTDGSHLTLLAGTKQGYANLSQLITESHRLPDGAVSRQPSVLSNETENGKRKTAVGAVHEPLLLTARPLTPNPHPA